MPVFCFVSAACGLFVQCAKSNLCIRFSLQKISSKNKVNLCLTEITVNDLVKVSWLMCNILVGGKVNLPSQIRHVNPAVHVYVCILADR